MPTPIILDKFPRAKILLIGSGWEAGGEAYLQRMKGLVGPLGLERSVVFTGFPHRRTAGAARARRRRATLA